MAEESPATKRRRTAAQGTAALTLTAAPPKLPTDLWGEVASKLPKRDWDEYRASSRDAYAAAAITPLGKYVRGLQGFAEAIYDPERTNQDKFNLICDRIKDSKPWKRGMKIAISQNAYDITKSHLVSMRKGAHYQKYYGEVFQLLLTLSKKDELIVNTLITGDILNQPSMTAVDTYRENQPFWVIEYEHDVLGWDYPAIAFYLGEKKRHNYIVLQSNGEALPLDHGRINEESNIYFLNECKEKSYVLVKDPARKRGEFSGEDTLAIINGYDYKNLVPDPTLDTIIASLVASFFYDDRVRAAFVDLSKRSNRR